MVEACLAPKGPVEECSHPPGARTSPHVTPYVAPRCYFCNWHGEGATFANSPVNSVKCAKTPQQVWLRKRKKSLVKLSFSPLPMGRQRWWCNGGQEDCEVMETPQVAWGITPIPPWIPTWALRWVVSAPVTGSGHRTRKLNEMRQGRRIVDGNTGDAGGGCDKIS